ncbi:ABC transporter permease [Pasteurellaceae bacterium Macca]|nr:ABC transporter permease [Pasteurellaceae bacterium Macca]
MTLAILTILAYLGALNLGVYALRHLEHHQPQGERLLKGVFALGLFACALHFASAFQHLFNLEGQNFTLTNVASLISLLMSLLATLALPKWKTIWFPVSIIYAIAIVCVAVASFVEGSVIKQLAENIGLLFHLTIAIFSYALFFIALLYAIQLKWLDHKLKNKQLRFSPVLPPLMTVERHFFNLTLVAQVILTLTLVTGMIYLHNFFASEQIHKAIFSFLAWLVYAILLLGQWKLHWRGNRVLIYSISGMMLLTIAYFGSRMV